MAIALQTLFNPKPTKAQTTFWFSLSLTFAVVYAIPPLQLAFSTEYIANDDARQHIFWMSRFIDPQLFPGDLIADYFQSVAPRGYTSVYRLFAWIGIDPFLLHKLLPIPLVLITTAYGFGVCLQMLSVPAAGFLSMLLLNQTLWMKDDIASTAPAGFVYPIFMAFLYYLLRRELLPCLGAIALAGLFYPQCVFIFCSILLVRLIQWKQGRLQLSRERQNYWFCAAGLGVALLVMLPYALQSSQFGSVISATAAKQLHAFSSEGWSSFFQDEPWKFWLCSRSGILPTEWCMARYEALTLENLLNRVPSKLIKAPFIVPQTLLGLLLPILLLFPARLPLVKQINRNIALLPQILLASLLMFFISHALLFRLHLPNRYTEYSFRIVFALAAGFAAAIVLDALLSFQPGFMEGLTKRRSLGRLSLSLSLAACLLLYPSLFAYKRKPFPVCSYVVGESPALYQFFAQQPKDILIASLAKEGDKLPSFSRRSILVGGEGYTLPYHLVYYREMTQRANDLIAAQYSPNLAEVKRFIQQYGVDFWLIEQQTFQPDYFEENDTFREFASATAAAQSKLEAGAIPALSQVAKSCTAFSDRKFTVIQAQCILNAK